MSSLGIVSHYAIRVDLRRDTIPRIEAWLSSVGNSYLVCREGGQDNPHLHLYLSSDLQLKGLQTSWRRNFSDYVGNASYSIKQCHQEFHDYLKYICKGSKEGDYPDVIVRQGLQFEDHDIVELHEDYWCSNREIHLHRKKEASVKLRGSICEQVEKAAKDQGLDGTDREAVARIYVQMYVDMRKGCNVFQGKAVVNTVCAVLSGHEFDQLCFKLAER